MIDLKPFCAVDDIRDYLNAPFVLDGHTAATNGHILIRVPGVAADVNQSPPEKLVEGIRKMFAGQHGNAVPLPSLPKPKKCKTCLGTGWLENGDCDDCNGNGTFMHGRHEYDCEECGGTGKVGRQQCGAYGCNAGIEREFVKIGPASFDAHYLRMIAALPNARISVTEKFGPAWIVFDGGDGLLMPANV